MPAKFSRTSLKEIVNGLKHTLTNEFSMHLIISLWIIMLIVSYIFHFNGFELALTVMLLGLITATELINTSLEAVVDLISPEYHKLAKIAKDTASAATGVFCVIAIICFVLIIINNLMGAGLL